MSRCACPMRAAGAGRSRSISHGARPRGGPHGGAAAAGREAAAALHFARVEATDWVRDSLAGLAAGRSRPLHRSRRARPRPHSRQPHRHRDRGGARLRHRPSRHDPRLPAGARPDCASRITRDEHEPTHPRSRHRQRRAGHRRRARAAPARAGDRHRCGSGPRRPRQRPAQSRRRTGRRRHSGRRHRRALRARAPFDLVFANILLGPLQRLAAPLRRLDRARRPRSCSPAYCRRRRTP